MIFFNIIIKYFMKRVAFFRNLKNRISPLMEVLVCDKDKCMRREVAFVDAFDVQNDELPFEDLEQFQYKEVVDYQKIVKFFWLFRQERGKAPFVLTLEDLPSCNITRVVYVDKRRQMWVANLEKSSALSLKSEVASLLLRHGDYRPAMSDFRKETSMKKLYLELFKDFANFVGLKENQILVLQVKSTA